MVRQPTLVQLSDDLVAALDERAARDGVRRSELIRVAVTRMLAEDAAAANDAAIVAGYTRVPPAHPDEWVADQVRSVIASEPW